MILQDFTVCFGDKLTRPQRILILLRDFPEIRDSYDLIVEKYRFTYKDDSIKISTLERDIRFIQYDMGIFPPSERVRRLRKDAQNKIIASKKKESLLSRILKRFCNMKIDKKTLNNARWCCNDCGKKYGKHQSGVATWHTDKCDVCGKENISVTEPRDFGYFDNFK